MEKRYSRELLVEVTENMRGLLQSGDRAEGVHLSDLNLCLNKAYYRRLEGDQELTDEQVAVFSLGRMGEAWMRQSFSDAEPILCEGIWCSLDHDGGEVPWELKVTKMSVNTPVPIHWVIQMKAYAYARWQKAVDKQMEKEKSQKKPHDRETVEEELFLSFNEFACVRLCVNGDYKQNRGMTVVPEIYTFTRQELLDNWEWLQERKDVLEFCLERENPFPPSKEISDYEGLNTDFNQCNGCGYAKGICPAERRGAK